MNKNCTVYKTVDIISKKWSLLILLELYKGKGTKRYTEIKKSIPDITPKILSQRLAELKNLGLIEKRTYSETVPIRCEYSLTESGRSIITIIKDIKKWALKWKIKNKACETKDCSTCEL